MRPTLLIPIFDHKDEIGGVVESLRPAGLPCLIIDDGSSSATRAVLDRIEAEHAWVEIHHHRRNGGRGAALKTGYREAFARGYSHALQLDADGQHEADDVPRFLKAMAGDPGAMVLGEPRFDETVPTSRLYGRQLSRVVVWMATLSFDIVDPLCGFRGIPLVPTLDLLDRFALGDHMEFDPELVIALHRRGVPVRSVPTRVVYGRHGLSHFDLVRDNLRLSGMYARSLAGLFWRIPARILTRARPREAS